MDDLLLHRIGKAPSAERDIRKLLDLILSTVRRLTKADAASVWLRIVSPRGNARLLLTASQTFKAFTLPIDDKTIVGYVVSTGLLRRTQRARWCAARERQAPDSMRPTVASGGG